MNRDALAAYHLAPVTHTYTARDTMLYAMGLGYGSSPLDASQLEFVYEQGREPLKVVPSMCVVLAYPGFWARDPSLQINWLTLLHGEQHFEIHRPLQPEGEVRGVFSILALEDKGVEKGAVVHQQKELFDVKTGEKLATVRSVLFLRGDGGCGSFGTPPTAPTPIPEATVDRSVVLSTSPSSALLYRLSGDFNPIHADPQAARDAGLGRPILHGLCTMGIATRAAIDALAPGAPQKIRSMSVRFSKPVYPGETIETHFFGSGPTVRFRSRVTERDVVVLDRGTLTLAEP